MPLSKEQLLKPRFRVLIDYPGSVHPVGSIESYIGDKKLFDYWVEARTKYKHVFQKLNWWEERFSHELPKYVRNIDGNIYELAGPHPHNPNLAGIKGITNEWWAEFANLTPEDDGPLDVDIEIPYVSLDAFNKKVNEFAKENSILKTLFNHPKSNVKTWEDLPPHLIQDLFKSLNCKPIIYKY